MTPPEPVEALSPPEPVELEPVERLTPPEPVVADAELVETVSEPVAEAVEVEAEPVEAEPLVVEATEAEPLVVEPVVVESRLPVVAPLDAVPLSGRLGEAELLDDLTRIEGITPVMARALAAEGLGSFFAVSNASEDQLRRALRVNRIRSAPGIAFWAAQAGELAQEEAAARAASTPLPENPSLLDSMLLPDRTTRPASKKVIDITDSTLAASRATAAEAEPPADLEWLAAHREAVRATQAEAAAAASGTPEPATPEPTALEQGAAEAPAASEPAATGAAAAPVEVATGAPASVEPSAATAVHAAEAAEDLPAPLLPPDPTPTPSSVVIKPSTGDDLERIEGIGPKIAEVLRAAGLTTYAAMAAAHDHELEAILATAGLRFAPTLSTWSVQAALLLQGDVAGADTLARGLMVGRETS